MDLCFFYKIPTQICHFVEIISKREKNVDNSGRSGYPFSKATYDLR